MPINNTIENCEFPKSIKFGKLSTLINTAPEEQVIIGVFLKRACSKSVPCLLLEIIQLL